MKPIKYILLSGMIVAAVMAIAPSAQAQSNAAIPQSMLTPDVVETGLGKLTFNDGAPTPETAKTVADFLIFTNGLNVYNNSFRGASAYALQQGIPKHRRGRQHDHHLLRADGLRSRCF